jgi:hypothetical protein
MAKNLYVYVTTLLAGERMGRINIVLSDEIEHKLRVAIAQEGGKKGDLSGSIEQAILEWLQKDDREAKKGKR